MRKQTVKRRISIDVFDLIIIAGLGMVACGAAMIWTPAAVIFGGISITVLGVVGAERAARQTVEQRERDG